MDDNSLPPNGLSEVADALVSRVSADRRAFIRRAALVGIPVVLATVKGRPAYAQTGSACTSLQGSPGCIGVPIPENEDISKPKKPKK